MKTRKNVDGTRRMTGAAGVLLAACLAAGLPFAAQAQEAPAQKPLTSREGGSTIPNIVLTMDESGSMAFQFLPEGTFKVGSYTVEFPSYTLVMHPDDPRMGNNNTWTGIVPADLTNESVFQKQMRSPDLNKVYYNPEVRYLPWIKEDGTRMADATYTAVRTNPLNSTPTLNLSTTFTKKSPRGANDEAEWCNSTADTTAGRNNECFDTSQRPFNPGIFYRLKKDNAGAYLNPATSSNYTLYNLNGSPSITWGKDSYPARTDCGTTCTLAQEKQNFANWYQYHRSRLHAAQAGVPEAFQSFDEKRLRVGWGDIKKGSTTVDGKATSIVEKGVRPFDGTTKTGLFTWMRSMSVSGGTPLRNAMYGVGEYYSRSDNAGPWGDNPGSTTSGPHKTCRRAYNVFVTDGYWNDQDPPSGVGNSDNTKGTIIAPNGYQYLPTRPYQDSNSDVMLADVAMHFWKRDLRPDLDNKVLPTADNPAYWQHMVNFTVGFGVKGKLDPATDLPKLSDGTKAWTDDKIDDLWHAAVNSRGQYFSATNASELADAIRTSLNSAVERELKEAGVAAAATVLEDGNRKYIPKYRTGVWSGDVDAYQLDANGQTGAKLWSASEHLPAWQNRKIFTWDSGLASPKGVAFDWAALTTASKTAMGAKGSQTLVNFIRGDRSNEGTTSGTYRKRDAVIADIVNSTPVFAKDGIVEPYSKLPNIGTAYATFQEQKAARTGVLYVGGNGGMLHGFVDSKGATPATDGTEVFAYVPRAVYPNLGTLTDQDYGGPTKYHQFFVDGALSERDAYVRAPGAGVPSWRNYLLGALGAGGRAVFALDVTDPNTLGASTVRWEVSSDAHPELGYITTPIEVGVVDDGSTTGKWVALFGNGYVDNNTTKATLFVVGLQDGAVTKLEVDAATKNGLGGVTLKRNSFGQIESLFAGDLRGNLWKINWNKSSGKFEVSNSGKPLFTTPSNQPIVQPPIVTAHADGDWVIFGTGRLLTVGDADSSQLQALYGLRLKTSDVSGTTLTKSNLVARTIAVVTGADNSTYFDLNGTAVDWKNTTYKGWSIDLTVAGYSGLRVSYAPQTIADELAFFSLIAPAQNVAECEQATGRGVNLIFPLETGLSPTQCILDTNGDGKIDSSDNCDVAGYATSADGIDAVLRSRNTVKTCKDGDCTEETRFSIQNTTGGRFIKWQKKFKEECTVDCDKPEEKPHTAKDRVWRRIVNPPIR
ncbi:hypothetical protein H8N03_18820 [Ramlibacter sp. USB13]|uniref:PilY1 beta-propeller domain-containing protein n=1 Tax=Ramlibacter cellulosilyticus TaxID=2764187 RepID=A0A923SGK2_9BURK|nr:PilC/PilY family type IV pilus protein [Ramlibacter cellulosilyticus]MBC5785007.1 hypothetical protein [Ramlibacter cellulosilyticus]